MVAFDIPVDPRWADFRELAATHGLRACWSSPIHGADGEVLGTFAVYHEVPHTPTRREARLVDRYRDLAAVAISHNRLWGALAASEEQFRRAFAASAVGMALLDLHGRFTRVNRAFCDLLARPETDLVGRHFAEITHPDDIARSVAAWAALAAGEVASGHQEKRYLRPDGGPVWVDVIASVVRGRDGVPLHISTNVVDLTARKVAEAERQARHAAEVARGSAETASRAKSEFLSTMSHELRTPLSAIVGFTELLDTLDLAGERRTTALGHIGRAARHIISILDDVLDLAKIEAGVVSIDRCPVRVAPVVHATCELLEPLADGRGLSVDLSGADRTVAVLADPRRLEQALLNVVSNAIKYNRPAGELHISCGPAPAAPNRVRITVRDTGLGIAPELQHRLFTPFDRLDAELHGEPGAGLGLVVTERLVAAMGGQLALHSEPGVGTVVEIDLDAWDGPLDAAAAAKPAPRGRRRALATGSVLYVEDDAAHRELVAEVLRARPGIQLCTCAGGGEALDALRADTPRPAAARSGPAGPARRGGAGRGGRRPEVVRPAGVRAVRPAAGHPEPARTGRAADQTVGPRRSAGRARRTAGAGRPYGPPTSDGSVSAAPTRRTSSAEADGCGQPRRGPFAWAVKSPLVSAPLLTAPLSFGPV